MKENEDGRDRGKERGQHTQACMPYYIATPQHANTRHTQVQTAALFILTSSLRHATHHTGTKTP